MNPERKFPLPAAGFLSILRRGFSGSLEKHVFGMEMDDHCAG